MCARVHHGSWGRVRTGQSRAAPESGCPRVSGAGAGRLAPGARHYRGTVIIEVIRDWGPRGADRFYNLARHGYYDENRFFRVNPGRWTQFGVNGDPAIAKAWRNRTFPDDPFKESNVRGTVAFAFAVPNGRTTQIFFNLGDNRPTHDPPSKDVFVPFGRVITGMDIVDSFNAEYREGPGGIRAGKQDPFFEGGNNWLLKEFPRLDYIKKVAIVTH